MSGRLLATLAMALFVVMVIINDQQLRIQAATAKTELARQQAEQLAEQRDQAASAAATLRTTLTRERTAQADLRNQHNQLRTALAARQRTIEELKRENQELRDWAVQPLPAAARRLRERPAITGAAGYRDWLSSRGAVTVAGEPASQ